MQLRRTVLSLAAAATVFGLSVGGVFAAEPKGPYADNLKKSLTKRYKTLDPSDTIGRSAALQEIQGFVAGEKDKKNTALKTTAWWCEQILQAAYSGDKYVVAQPKIKEIVKLEVEYMLQGDDGPATKGWIAYRGPNLYNKLRSAPMLLSIVDSKTDPKAWIEKAWAGNEDFAKDWILVAVAESDAFDVAKDKVAPARILGRMARMFNVDPNRTFLEGVGTACRSAQLAASLGFPDRLAGVVLRNPPEAVATENCGIFPTVVVKGPEGAEKATAVFAKFKEAVGDTKAIELTSPDVASLDGPCAPVAEWLKAAKPRETPHAYSWTAPFDKNGISPNPWTGTVNIVSPVKNGEPTKLKVAYLTETNTVDIQATNLGEFWVCINDDLLDLDKDVAIFVNGNQLKKQLFERRVDMMLDKADDFGEWGRLFPVWVNVIVPTQVPVPDKKNGGAAPGGGDKK